MSTIVHWLLADPWQYALGIPVGIAWLIWDKRRADRKHTR